MSREVGLKNIYTKYLNPSFNSTAQTPNSEDEYNFIVLVLEKYYTIDRSISTEGKTAFISNYFSEKTAKNLLQQHALAVAHFHKTGGMQKSSIEKIFYSKSEQNYTVFLNVHQKVPQQTDSTYLVQLKVHLQKDDAVKYKITGWDEKILSIPPEILTLKDLKSDEGIVSVVNFPCKINSISPLNDRNEVELKLSADSQTVKFHTQNHPQESSTFKAICNQRNFLLQVSYDPDTVTIYQSLKLTDGEPIKKSLSRQEKVNLGIKNQLKDWGIEAAN